MHHTDPLSSNGPMLKSEISANCFTRSQYKDRRMKKKQKREDLLERELISRDLEDI